jgi:DNA-directed RNA polymerase specialized sigma24 family protein
MRDFSGSADRPGELGFSAFLISRTLETVWDRLFAKGPRSEEDEACQLVKTALDKLPENYQKVLIWRYYEKKSFRGE